MSKNYQSPKVVRMTNMNKAKGECNPGSGDSGICGASGNSAGGICVFTGNAATADCGPSGNGF